MFSDDVMLRRNKAQVISICLIVLLFLHDFFYVAFLALSKNYQLAKAGSFRNTFPDYGKEKWCYTALLR